GDIISTGAGAIIRSAKTDLEAEVGTIGTSTARVNVEVVKSANRTTDLDATSGHDVFLNVKGRLRDPAVTNFVVNAGDIEAATGVNTVLQDAIREPTAVVPNYTVVVSLPQLSPSLVTVSRIFRPGQSAPAAPPADLGVFGTSGVTTIGATYDFNLI